jgi:hypothetical protein
MVRLPLQMKADCELIAEVNGITVSDVIRLSIKRNLPDLKAGRLKLVAIEGAPTEAGR